MYTIQEFINFMPNISFPRENHSKDTESDLERIFSTKGYGDNTYYIFYRTIDNKPTDIYAGRCYVPETKKFFNSLPEAFDYCKRLDKELMEQQLSILISNL